MKKTNTEECNWCGELVDASEIDTETAGEPVCADCLAVAIAEFAAQDG